MRQQNKRSTRKERLREAKQAKRNAKIFIGNCSNCPASGVEVVRFRGGQVCVGKCLGTALSRLGRAPQMPANQAIKVE